MLKEYCTREDYSVSKSAAPVALLTVTDGNSSPNYTEDDVDLLDDQCWGQCVTNITSYVILLLFTAKSNITCYFS